MTEILKEGNVDYIGFSYYMSTAVKSYVADRRFMTGYSKDKC